MTVGYDMERLMVALEGVVKASDAPLRKHAAELEEWQSHRIAHVRDEARSLLEDLRGGEPLRAGQEETK